METISTTIKINDAFSNPLNKLAAGLSKGQSAMGKLKSALGGSAFSGAEKSSNGFFKSMVGGTVVGGLINKGMGLASNGIRSMLDELDEASTSWQTFEGNMHQIGRTPAQISSAKKDMQKFAQQTIYSASDMSSTYSQLAAVGTKNVGKLVKGFGGLAAASSNPQQAMKTLSEQATQMAAKPKVQWQDFKLMLEQTPAGISAVAKSMGESTQQLIKNVQDGKVKTEDFLNAVAKTGTNANFSKMATQYKTVGQAMDGLKETLANGLQDQFQKVSKIGINAVSSLTDSLSNLNWDAFGDGIVNAINYIQPALKNLKNGFSDLFEGFTSTGVGDSLTDMFKSIADAVKDLTGTMSKSKGGDSLFKQLGKLGGGALSGAAKAISGIAKAIGNLDPGTITALARAFILLKGGVKGIVLATVVKGLQQLNKLNPGTIEGIAKALTTLALAFTVLKAVGKGMAILKGIKDAFSGMGGLKTPKMQMPETPKAGGILQSAGAFMKLGAALLMVGGAVVLVALGFKLIADAATQLASGGGAAIAVFFGMIAAIALLAVLVRILGPAMIGASVGFLMFAAALLLIGAAIFIASAGLALLATQLPTISQYGTSAAVGLLALAGAIAVFGLATIVGAVGLIALGVALVVVAVGLALAAVGALLLGIALMLVGVGALVAAVGIILLGVGLALVAVFAMIAAVGILLLGVGLMLVAVFAMVGAVGLMLMAVALMLIMVSAMIAAIGLILLGVALTLIGPMAMIAGVGMMLLAVALVMIAPMAMLAAVGMLLMGAALMLIMASAMVAAVGLMMLAVSLILIGPMSMLAAVSMMLLGVALMIVAAGLTAVAGAAMMAAAAIIMIGVAVMTMVSLMIAAGAAMVAAITGAMSNVVSAVRNGVQGAVNAVKGFVGAMVSAGADLIRGLIQGIQSMIGSVVSAAQSLASKVAGAVKGALHIGSPSRLFRQYGRWVDQGFIIGLNRDAGAVGDAASNIADTVINAANSIQPTVASPQVEDYNPNKLFDNLSIPSKPLDLQGNLVMNGIGDTIAAISDVIDAVTGLDGIKANVGIDGLIGSDTPITGTTDPGVTSKDITSNSIGGSTTSYGNTDNRTVNIQQGAIQVNSTGNAETDVDAILTELEQRILNAGDKAL